MTDSFTEIVKMFPAELREEIYKLTAGELKRLTEIRIRSGMYCQYRTTDIGRTFINGHLKADKHIIDGIYSRFTSYSSYAYESELKNGFITLPGGHRAGICGRTVMENDKVKLIDNISSINIRRAAEHIGVAAEFYNYILTEYELRSRKQTFPNILIISPPGCGKTTFIRDLIRLLAGSGLNIGICDERSEIAGMYESIPSFDIGSCVDILDRCPKADGMKMMLRSMAPDIIATDEIGTREDVEAIRSIAVSGVGLLATAHGDSLENIKKSMLRELINEKYFNTIVFLKKEPYPCTIQGILNSRQRRCVT